MLVIWICGNPATPALIPFGEMLEPEVAPLLLPVPLTALFAAVLEVLLDALLEVLLDALLATTMEEIGELSSSATATDGVETEAVEDGAIVEAAELAEAAPAGPL